MKKNPEIQFRSPEEIKAYQDSTNVCSKHIISIYNR